MDFLNGTDRNQLQLVSLEDWVAADSWARVVDAFVDALPLAELGFQTIPGKEGRPPYHPADLLKLYVYGYRNGLRSSRKLEKACTTNVEVMWLIKGLRPKNRTIAYFRKKHSEAFSNTFKHFVLWLRDWEMIGGETIAIDSVKIRAQNSLKNNFNQGKIKRHLDYIEEKVKEYTDELDAADDLDKTMEVTDKIKHQKAKAARYRQLEQQLKDTGQSQISTTDPDAKAVILHRNIVNVGYNVQFASDAKHKMLIHMTDRCEASEVVNRPLKGRNRDISRGWVSSVNDTHALGYMATEVKDMLELDHLNVLADKGYTTGSELQMCKHDRLVRSIRGRKPTSKRREPRHQSRVVGNLTSFSDTYSCPANETLTTNGRYYDKGRNYRIKRYSTKACQECPLHSQCTTNQRGRFIERSEYQSVVDENRDRVLRNKDYYRERQQVIEHQFEDRLVRSIRGRKSTSEWMEPDHQIWVGGKRQWHFTHTLMRGKAHVMSEVHIIAMCYNLRRLTSILDPKALLKRLKSCFMSILRDMAHIYALYLHDSVRTRAVS